MRSVSFPVFVLSVVLIHLPASAAILTADVDLSGPVTHRAGIRPERSDVVAIDVARLLASPRLSRRPESTRSRSRGCASSTRSSTSPSGASR